MKLTEYFHKLATDKRMPLDDRVVYLYDTKNNTYFTKVLYVADVDGEGPVYLLAGDEPFHDYASLNVIRAYTTTNCINVIMGLEALTDNYAESEV